MASELTIRAAQPQDETAWRALWAGYCAFYEATIPEDVTRTTWARILDPAQPIHALVALDEDGTVIGLANYVVHPYTWGVAPACYLEDLFVDEDARGRGAGEALIRHLARLGEECGWSRVYWMTREGNARARRVYDRIAARDDFVRYVVRIADDASS
ncbi:MAG: GNAT family N-acetyltransferase [Vulcanimicrobiaceae bacterium]